MPPEATVNAQFSIAVPGGATIEVAMVALLRVMLGRELLRHIVAMYGGDIVGDIWVYQADYTALSNRMTHVFYGSVMSAHEFLQTPGGA